MGYKSNKKDKNKKNTFKKVELVSVDSIQIISNAEPEFEFVIIKK